MNNKHLKRTLKRNAVAYSFVLPDLIGLTLFIIIPIIYAGYISLFNYNFANVKEFIGLQNYITMFHDSRWLESLGKTLKLTAMYVPSLFILSLLCAVLISYIDHKKSSSIIKTSFLFPYAITSVVASCLWKFLLVEKRGFVNVFLKFLGLPMQKFLGSPDQAMACIVIVLLWINLGYNTMLFLSAIKDIPRDYTEAAKIDGANKFQIFRSITFPLIKQTSIFVLITTTIASFQCLDFIMVMTGGGPAESTEVAALYIYDQSFQLMKAGYASALSVVLFFALAVFAVVLLKLFNRKDRY